jgi:hypothetical protein
LKKKVMMMAEANQAPRLAAVERHGKRLPLLGIGIPVVIRIRAVVVLAVVRKDIRLGYVDVEKGQHDTYTRFHFHSAALVVRGDIPAGTMPLPPRETVRCCWGCNIPCSFRGGDSTLDDLALDTDHPPPAAARHLSEGNRVRSLQCCR